MNSQSLPSEHTRVGMTISQHVLLIPIQVELYDDVLQALQHDALAMIQKQGLNKMLLDLSQVHIMDAHIAQALAQLLKMAKLLGTRSIVAGIQPGVAVSLIEWADVWQDVETALSLDAGLQALQA